MVRCNLLVTSNEVWNVRALTYVWSLMFQHNLFLDFHDCLSREFLRLDSLCVAYFLLESCKDLIYCSAAKRSLWFRPWHTWSVKYILPMTDQVVFHKPNAFYRQIESKIFRPISFSWLIKYCATKYGLSLLLGD